MTIVVPSQQRDAPAPPGTGERGPGGKAWLAARRDAVLGLALLPVLAVVVTIAALAYRQHNLDIEGELRRHVDTLATAVERQIEQEYGVLIALAALPAIRVRDFEALRGYLLDLKAQRRTWFNVIVTDRQRQIFNLNRWPETVELHDPQSLAHALDLKAPAIGPLRDGYFSLRAPIVFDGRAEMTITAALDPAALAGVLRLSGLPPGWIAVVVDEEGRVIARNLDPELYVGRPATPIYLEAVRADSGHAVAAKTLDGRDALLMVRRLGHGAWSVGIAAPRSDLAARWLRGDRLIFVATLAVAALVLTALALTVLALSRRRAAERAALRRVAASDARFRDGIEAMADGLQLWDADRRLVAWNARYLELYPMARDILRPGLAQEEFVRLLLPRVLPEATPAEVAQMIAERERDFRAHVNSWERRLPDGRIVEVKDRPTSDGGTVSLFHEVTAERRATANLALGEARFHDFAASASDWFWETDAENRFTYLSFASGTLAGDPIRAIDLTRAEWARLNGVEVPEAYVRLDAIMARREPFSAFTCELKRFDTGEPQIIELFGKPIFDAEGVFAGYRGTGRDVTRAKQQEIALKHALAAERQMNAEQRRFIAVASHEFRTPLTIIDGAAQRIAAHVAKDGQSVPKEVLKRLARIRKAVTLMTGIIDRTLSSSRLEEGSIALQAQRFDLRELLREVVARQRRESPDFEIVVDLPSVPLALDGDRLLLEQAFSNLLSNAVKYSGTARRVEVAAALDGDATCVRVQIRDRGLGIPPDDVPKLFTRFFRARNAMGISGIGIGLYVVREFVALHGGSVDVVSDVGNGSTFSVGLPVVAPAEAASVQ